MAGAQEDHRAALNQTLKTLAALSTVEWHPPVALLAAWRSFIEGDYFVRIPLIVHPDAKSDLIVARALFIALFDAKQIHVQALSQTTLARLFAESGMLPIDLTYAHEGLFLHIKQLASYRRLAGAVIACVKKDALEFKPIKGECAVIVPECGVEVLEPIGLLLELVQPGFSVIDPVQFSEQLNSVKPMFALDKKRRFEVDPADLPHNRFIDPVRWRGFLFLAALARHADLILPEGRFLEAVRAAWAEATSHAAFPIPESRRKAILAAHILSDIKRPPDYRDGHREDITADKIKAQDELYPNLDANSLGRILTSWKVGLVDPYCRKRFPPDPKKGETEPVFRRYRVYNDSHKAKLRQIAGDEVYGDESIENWIIGRFAGQPAVRISEVITALRFHGKDANEAQIYQTLERLPQLEKPTPDVYDFTQVEKPQGDNHEPIGKAPPQDI